MTKKDQLYNAVEVIFESIFYWCKNNKRKVIILLIFELWVHSLMFSHLTELKQIWDLVPFHQFISTGQ